MTDVLGLGMTHYPMLLGPDAHMAGLLRRTLRDPDIPADKKDPANWSERARREWAADQGVEAAARHRAELLAHLERCRAELDAFRPDVVVVWGDDQYENFREEVIPPFCVLAYDDTVVEPFGVLRRLKMPNVWDLPDDTTYTMRGMPEFAKKLASDVLAAGLDCAYSYELRKGIHFPHSFANTQVFLDYDDVGSRFPYPMVPIALNCYGEHVIARRGGMATFAEIGPEENLDPPGPSPARCYELGRAVGRSVAASGKRVALVASSSWSHAFLNDKDWHLRPDTEADQRLYDAMVAGDHDAWTRTTTREIVGAGQHEMLNWFCLLGAVAELGLRLQWSELTVTEIFNSNKAFAAYR
ncbi:extradiol ring-cleavage dioxygenase [Streptomyces sp. MMG1533]|uniref:DODA-type extradiol aromatic ring-opening family dioxygenase n=1 Tax=Streptomyces sp. MMG1533 TaxID=1415546 RepID=UPI0006AECBD8|nr:extradiol ring-cleavage dioxygenase [Streptomyces sp. MMG1533]KOU59800.1 extradiol ring-cleavage dioxygenase [Streptomyces sp. MMG1533]